MTGYPHNINQPPEIAQMPCGDLPLKIVPLLMREMALVQPPVTEADILMNYEAESYYTPFSSDSP